MGERPDEPCIRSSEQERKRSEMNLTEPQLWALTAIAQGKGKTPSQLGQAMMERPGASEHRNGTPYKSQGYGRMGGAMMSRLRAMGLIYTDGWPTTAQINGRGLAILNTKSRKPTQLARGQRKLCAGCYGTAFWTRSASE